MLRRAVIAAAAFSLCAAPAALSQTSQTNPWSAMWGEFTPTTQTGRGLSAIITLPSGAEHFVIRGKARPQHRPIWFLGVHPLAGGSLDDGGPFGPESDFDYRQQDTIVWGLRGSVASRRVKVSAAGVTRWSLSIAPVSTLPPLSLPATGTGHRYYRYAGPLTNIRLSVAASRDGSAVGVREIAGPGSESTVADARPGQVVTGQLYDAGAAIIEIGNPNQDSRVAPRWTLTAAP